MVAEITVKNFRGPLFLLHPVLWSYAVGSKWALCIQTIHFSTLISQHLQHGLLQICCYVTHLAEYIHYLKKIDFQYTRNHHCQQKHNTKICITDTYYQYTVFSRPNMNNYMMHFITCTVNDYLTSHFLVYSLCTHITHNLKININI